jgi:hypothetical protein
VSKQLAILVAVAGVALTGGIFISPYVLPQPNSLPSTTILSDARTLDEVQSFLKRYPNSTEQISVSGGVSNVLFVSPKSSEVQGCSDEFCSEVIFVRPYIRVIAGNVEPPGYLVYCGNGIIDSEGQIKPRTEFRPFDEKNSLC